MGGKGADLTVTAEEPPGWLIASVGPQEEIYSAEVNFWLLRAALTVIKEKKPSLLYVTTTDFSQHKFGPETAEGQEHLASKRPTDQERPKEYLHGTRRNYNYSKIAILSIKQVVFNKSI